MILRALLVFTTLLIVTQLKNGDLGDCVFDFVLVALKGNTLQPCMNASVAFTTIFVPNNWKQ